MRPRRRLEMKPETSENSVEYTVGEDDVYLDTSCERGDDSTSSESDNEERPFKPAGPIPDNAESDGGSSSTDDSSDSSHHPKSKTTPAVIPANKNSVCETCGRGPFRSLKLHLLHCRSGSGVRVKDKCFLCKELFSTETLLNEHYMSLYSCDSCGQVFSNEVMYCQHPCSRKSKSSLALFCPESMPHVCRVCKLFFTSEKTLLNHVTKVHASLVSTKVCIITNPSVLTDKHGNPEDHVATSIPNVFNQAVNGKLHDGQTSPSSFLTSSLPGQPPAPTCTGSPTIPLRMEKDSTTELPLGETPASLPSDPDSQQMPTILAMFENGSHNVALMKRMNTGWRSKPPHPCRQCGAIFRQPSLLIRHRYLHRGHRSYQCQCGRAFKHQLYLLRHCVEHAENMSYICTSCGGTFTGASVLAKHLKGKTLKNSYSGRLRNHKVKQKCRMPFTCDCGQLFIRPSAYIWHQLKNGSKTKSVKKCSKR
ncbi:zinc finger protein 836 [Xyrichtys novacula]|uniref:Zinc finger protein 836 n=1 Tax=Xyrichtys novacula TaxID=13765 RepID=A0AAV1FL31_XYRNO|nr:zinc finger protein 836 [Xyrichtys novacula]